VGDKDQVMMITDAGRLIRIPVGDIRVAGRATQGVTMFSTGEDEHVTSVAHLPLEENGEGEGEVQIDTQDDASADG
jgi:DNA gyrase subunit A